MYSDIFDTDVWKGSLTSDVIAFFSKNGFLYIDSNFAERTKYDGKGKKLAYYSIYQRYFGDHISDGLPEGFDPYSESVGG